MSSELKIQIILSLAVGVVWALFAALYNFWVLLTINSGTSSQYFLLRYLFEAPFDFIGTLFRLFGWQTAPIVGYMALLSFVVIPALLFFLLMRTFSYLRNR